MGELTLTLIYASLVTLKEYCYLGDRGLDDSNLMMNELIICHRFG